MIARPVFLGVLAAVASGVASGPVQAENITFPSGANVKSVTSYGAVVNDGVDDTAAIQSAINDCIHKARTLYFPNGTYNVSNTLDWKRTDGTWDAGLTLQGQSRSGVILKLKDNTFTDTANPKAIIRTATQNATNSNGGGNGQAFANSIRNMTIDTGSGNTAAIGIDYLSNNSGSITDVTIKTSDGSRRGISGISMLRDWPGPSLIKNVSITGFNYGIDTHGWTYSQTFEYVTLQNQLAAGIRNGQQNLSIRNLTSTNSVPVIQGWHNEGALTVIDANLTGGGASNYAIDFQGSLLARNVVTSGYAGSIRNANNNTTVTGTTVAEYTSHAVQSLNASPSKTLGLPVEEPSLFVDENTANWQPVDGSADDDTSAIQTAMNSGKSTIYFPNNYGYKISGTVTVPASVRRIIGLDAGLEAIGNLVNGTSAAFRFNGTTTDSVTFERFSLYPFSHSLNFVWFEHASTRPLILKDICCFAGKGYRNTVNGGKVYIEDVSSSGGWVFTGQKVWARQFNPEFGGTLITNDGGDFWVLGLKTEGTVTVIETKNSGRTEVLGGLLYPLGNTETPAFINNESNVSLSYTDTGNENYVNPVREIRGGVTKNQTMAMNNSAGLSFRGHTMTLYTGYLEKKTTNLVSNPSFDAENYDTQTPSGWSEAQWDVNTWNTVSADASYTEAYGGSASGARHGTHWRNTAYAVYTSQLKTGLANGLYTLRVKAKSGGGQISCLMEAKGYGGSARTVDLPVSSTYQTVEIKDINVTNGQCTIGFWSQANAGNWAYFDDVEFFQQDGTTLFATGFESGDTQPTWRDSIESRQSVSGYLTGIEPECSTRPGEMSSTALMYSGKADASYAYCYYKVFEVNIPVSASTQLSYKIYPQSDNARYVGIDLLCTDGTTLRDSGAVDSNGYSFHPSTGHGGNIPLNAWTTIQGNIGSKLAGKTISKIWVAFDRYNGPTGTYRGYIDDIKIAN